MLFMRFPYTKPEVKDAYRVSCLVSFVMILLQWATQAIEPNCSPVSIGRIKTLLHIYIHTTANVSMLDARTFQS